MTKRQRAQVVELLRCAADSRPDGIGLNGMFDTACWLDFSGDKQDAAWDAVNSVPTTNKAFCVVGFVDEAHERENPGALEKRLGEVVKMFKGKRKRGKA